MCQLIETIRIENGVASLLTFHQKRMDKARNELFGVDDSCILSDHLSSFSLPQSGIWKCRITYGVRIEKTEIEPYMRRTIHTLQLIEAHGFNYDYKFARREGINKLFEKRGQADDILIIKNNLLTDTSYCNIALWNGTIWMTPLSPLLKGVRRESLIQLGCIQVADIGLKELSSFQSLKLFNAMISFEEAFELPISSVLF